MNTIFGRYQGLLFIWVSLHVGIKTLIDKPKIILLIIAAFGITAFGQKRTIEIRNDFKKYYDQFKVEGSFVLYDPQTNKCVFYNPDQYEQTFTPASTFKICNSLIGLETGVIKDENFIISWDSVNRQNPKWNIDQDLKTAFKNSTVWYYQELARRVGKHKMKSWLKKVKYGNKCTSGGIDKFWLTGGLRISPKQQIDFLQRLHDNQLPFSQRSVDIVKNIMIVKDTLDYVVRAKSGWGGQDNKDIGWYVGYLETKDQVYYFANCIQSADLNNEGFATARIDIVYQILKELKLIDE